MATRLTHVLDEATHEDGLRLLSLLLRRMPSAEVIQQVIVIGRTPAVLTPPEQVPVTRISRRFNWPVTSALDLQRILTRHRPDAVLAWSPAAAAAVRTSGRGELPTATVVCDPADTDQASRWWRSTNREPGRIDVICMSGTIQRKLIEAGIPAEVTAVIRPGVDFAQIRQAKERMQRSDIGLPKTGRVLLTTSPPSRQGGQFYAVWAMALLHQIWPDASLIIPGTSHEQRRILRLIDNLYCPQIYFPTADRFSPAELLAVSDMLVVPAIDDIGTGSLAWAMSAGVPIVASAVPTVAELIADQHNGFLCKPGNVHILAVRIRAAAEAGHSLRQCVETARNQAFEVFRAEACVDEYLKVIRNLSAGTPALANIHDTAIDA